MDAGRDLDTKIARLMGLNNHCVTVELCSQGAILRCTLCGDEYCSPPWTKARVEQEWCGDAKLPSYSTNLTDAWRIIDHMRSLGWHYEVGAVINKDTHWAMFGSGYYDAYEDRWERQYDAVGSSPAHAICLAALAVFEVDI